jgi:hypothetical protein
MVDPRLIAYAPILRLGPEERFSPIDSAEFLARASLVRENQASPILGVNSVTDAELARIQPSEDTYLELFPDAELPVHLQRALPGIVGRAARVGRRAIVEVGSALGARSLVRLGEQRLKSARAMFPFEPTASCIHGCVTETGGYVALQYWLFYAYNDWGTSHGGWNDHEGDWENIHVFLKDEKPAWIALSAHGAATRVGWNRKLEKKGTHPIVCVAQGSHANYLSSDKAGEDEDPWWHTQKGFTIQPTVIDLATLAWPNTFKGRWGATFNYLIPGDRRAREVNGPVSLAAKQPYTDPLGWAPPPKPR